MSQHSPVLVSRWSDVGDDLIFLLGPAGPGGSLGFCNLLWRALVLGGIGNIGFGYALWGLLPSYLAI